MMMNKHELEAPREADRPVSAHFGDDMLYVTLQDGRIIATPLMWYPTLTGASESQRANVEFSASGLHWPDLDEDLSVQGMLRGVRPPTRQKLSVSG